MKKYAILVGLALIALLLFLFYKTEDNNIVKKRELITELSPLECDLNKTECKVFKNGKEITFNYEPKPLKILKETKIYIKGLDDIKNLNARLYGLNMYMGDIVSEFEKENEYYVGYIVFSSCVESIMRYRFELFDGDKSLDIYVDFDVEK